MSTLVWDGTNIEEKVRTAGAEGLLSAAELLLEESNRIVPYDTGALCRSGEASVDAEELVASVSYDTPYAVRLHEHPEYHFKNGRQGKWLETAVSSIAALVLDKIGAPIRRALGG